MDLLVVHGPPGIGKETVGAIVAARTGYPRLSYHDVAAPFAAVLGWGTPSFYAVRDQVVPTVIRAALREPIDGLLLTYIFDPTVNRAHFDDYAASARTVFVGLTCDRDEHLQRASSDARRQRSKWIHPDHLGARLDAGEFDFPVELPGPSHVLDTSGRSPEDVADEIVALL